MKKIILNICTLVIGLTLFVESVILMAGEGWSWYYAMHLVVGLFISAVTLYVLYRDQRDYREASESLRQTIQESRVDPTLVGLTQVDLWQAALKKLDVEVRQDEDRENRYLFDFQGGHFYADVDNTVFSDVYYAFIEELDLSDIDEVSVVRRAINETNYAAGINVVYSTSDDSDQMHVHMVQSVLLMPQLPHLKDYVESRLAAFFQLQRRYANIEDKLRIS